MDLQHLSDHAAYLKYVTYSGLGFGSASGVWTWMDENAGAIGALCSIIGVSLGVASFVLNRLANRRR